MNRTVKVLGAFSMALTLLATLAQATQVEYRSPQQLGSESALVVHGTVKGVRSYWNESHTKIITETSIDVDRTYKGSAAGTVSVVQLGGVVGHVRMTVHGALSWRPDEEVLLFLDPSRSGAWQVSGFSQGKFNVVRDETGSPYVEHAPDSGDAVIGAPVAPGGAGARAGDTRVTLGDFVDQALGRR